MLRFLVYLAIAIGLFYVATEVPIGRRTLVGHVRAIWHTEEVKDLRDGVSEKTKPAVERLERGAKAGYDAAAHHGAKDEAKGGSNDGSAAEASK
jgi:hypothetical protein